MPATTLPEATMTMEYVSLTTMGDLLVRGAAETPDRDFLVISGERVTYRGMHDRATAVAQSLLALGIARGDAVGLLMPNSVAFLEVVFAATCLGAISVPINSRFRRSELQHVIPDAGIRVLFLNDAAAAQADHLDRLRDAFPGMATAPGGQAGAPVPMAVDGAPDLAHVVAFGGGDAPGVVGEEAFRALGADIDPAAVTARRRGVAIRDVAMMFYTSGTTSNPKGCGLSHEALVRVGRMTAQGLGYRDGDVMFDPLPMFHTASTQPMLAMMDVRGTFVSMVHPDPDEALDLIEQERATQMFTAFPTITESLLNHPRYQPGTTFKRVRTLFNVAPYEAQRSIQSRMPGTTLVNAFGMTETAGSATMVDASDPDEERMGTQGPPMPGIEVQIRGEDNSPLPRGERGEIVLRGPSLFEGYHKAPEKNAETIEADGFWHSGDLGLLRPDGRLVFLGRIKDMLKVGGENVAAIEIESHLQAHPAVNIAQVIGYPDAKYGEVPAAFIELRPNAMATEEELIAHCSGAIAGFKVPRYVRFVTEWPMSSTKVQKFRLHEILDQEPSTSQG